MKIAQITLLILSILSLSACKNTPEQQADTVATVTDDSPVLEVITRGFSVKDSAGNKIKDSLQAMQSIVYAAGDKELSNIFYNLNGTIAWEDRYTYNDKGQKSGSKYYEQGQHRITYKYELDSLGRRIGYSALDAATAVELYRGYSAYENDGKLRKDGIPGPSGVVQWNYEYLFDDMGEETGYVYIAPDGSRFPSMYQTTAKDDKGRWTERAIMEQDTVIAIETRTYKELD